MEIQRAESPLAEGRELKFRLVGEKLRQNVSPLAEGRELKYGRDDIPTQARRRPSRRGVN